MPERPEDSNAYPWRRLAALGVWLGLMAFGIQFAIASAAELEPQAAVMGWMLVAIVLGAGLSVVVATLVNHSRDSD